MRHLKHRHNSRDNYRQHGASCGELSLIGGSRSVIVSNRLLRCKKPIGIKPAGSGASYGSLAFDGNTLSGMDLGTPTDLVTIDALGNVTDLGPSVNRIDGIAFTVAVPEPASPVRGQRVLS
jgi:hypothetical protein